MLNHQGTQRLETPRLVLRQFTPADAPAMFNGWANDPEVTRYLSWPPHRELSVTRELLLQWEKAYENPEEYNWCIELRETGQPIGSAGLPDVNSQLEYASLGYVLARPYWRRGLAAEAAAAIVEYSFHVVGFHRLAAVHVVENKASGAVMRKLGMQYEGRVREAYRNGQGQYVDTEQYAILRREWAGPQRLYAAE